MTLAFVLGGPVVLTAQENSVSASVSDGADSAVLVRPVMRTGVLEGLIDLDGRLDDVVWQTVTPATGFVQRDPVEGAPAVEDTEVRILFSSDAIYVGARMFDSHPQTIEDRLTRRDERGFYDYFEILLDPNLDQRTGYVFRVSAANVQGDRFLFDDTREDGAWNVVWDSEVSFDEQGWTAEMRIPLSQIRYEASEEAQAWGVNFSRRRIESNELTYYSLESELQRGRVSQFGTMEGVEVPRSPGRLEFRPYLLSSAETGPATDGDPFFDGRDFAGRAGFELNYGLGASFTLNATVNPDFGQVESDPAVINLSAFETFFREQRPFFVEDAQAFNFSLSGFQNTLFYTRRIGRAPQGRAPFGSRFSDIPDATTILGSVKVSGRTEGGLSIGALGAVTDSEEGKAYFSATDSVATFLAEPRTGYGVIRIQQDFNGGASQVGGIATGLYRDLPGDGSFDFLARQAYNVGLDFEHQWGNRTWALTGFIAGSFFEGYSASIIRIQRSSNHYFQRPDATRFSVDSTATSLDGLEWRLEFAKRSGEHWTGAVWLGEVTSGFEINDFGFSRNTERLDMGGRVSYREVRPGNLFRNYRLTFSTFHNFSHEALDDVFSTASWGRAHTSANFRLDINTQLLNYWDFRSDINYNPETMRRTLTRGGPIMADPGGVRANFNLNTDRRSAFSIGGNVNIEKGPKDSKNRIRTGINAQLRPVPWLELRVEPAYTRDFEGVQYVTATSTDPYEPTFGRRYFFGDLERRNFSMETRLNVTFSPDLTLQLFAQPLISSGDYVRYKQLAAPETFDFLQFAEGEFQPGESVDTCVGGQICEEVEEDGDRRQHLDLDGDGGVDFSFGDRDFNSRSLVGNAVIRWEYRPGSTVFLVWQHRRRDIVNDGDFALGSDVGDLFGAPGENIFMLKISHYLGF